MKPVRVALFAPGSEERVMAKAIAAGADAVIFDLEDSVPLSSKAAARGAVARAIEIATASSDPRNPLVFVRVNATNTGLLADDLAAVVRPGLAAVMLPKAERVDEVQGLAAALDRLEAAARLRAGSVQIMPQIESALGVVRCFELASASPRVFGTCIGGARDGDLQTDLGCGWSLEGTELLYARSKVLLDTRAAGKACPLDGVFSDLGDEPGLVADSTLSARLGYVGRTVIHPKQIAPVRRAYAVPEAQLAYYRKVVSEFETAEKGGVAAIAVEGKLVDYAMYQRAKRVLQWAALDAR
jgi:citrate lyase subunit beta/citryl-CoA lyase